MSCHYELTRPTREGSRLVVVRKAAAVTVTVKTAPPRTLTRYSPTREVLRQTYILLRRQRRKGASKVRVSAPQSLPRRLPY